MKICVVASETMLLSKDNFMDPSIIVLSKILAQKHSVDILMVDTPTEGSSTKHDFLKQELRQKSINLLGLDYPSYELHTPFLSTARSFLVFSKLKKKSYDLVIFQDSEGLGYYSMLAQQVGVAFSNCRIALNFYGPSDWLNRQNEIPVRDISDIAQDFIEKTSYKMANHIFFPTEFARSYAFKTKLTGSGHTDNDTLLFTDLNYFQKTRIQRKPQQAVELCFLGQADIRTGIECFLEATAQLMDANMFENLKVTVIGQLGTVRGECVKDLLNRWSLRTSRSVQVISDFDPAETRSYLKKNNAVAVLPYAAEFVGAALINCILNEIPFICSDIPTFIEINQRLKPKQFWTFPYLSPRELAVQMASAIQNRANRMRYSEESSRRTQDLLNRQVKAWGDAVKALRHKQKTVKKTNHSKISVCIIFFDRPDFLMQCLESLSPIDSIVQEILIYVNSDQQQASKAVLTAVRKRSKIRCLYGKKNISPGAAYNILAREARSESLLFIDDDNILNFTAFKKLWGSINFEWDIICCTLKKFHSSDLVRTGKRSTALSLAKQLEKITYAEWLPLGASIPMSVLHNHIGDNNFLIKKSHLVKIGGVNEDMRYNEDAELIVRSVHKGGKYFLSPESFIYYRKHSQNLSSEKVNYAERDINSTHPILRSIGSEQLLPLVLATKTMLREPNRNPDGTALAQIELASSFRKYKGVHSRKNLKELREHFKNKIDYNDKTKSLSCRLLPKTKMRQKSKQRFPDKTLHLIFYSEDNFEIWINGHPWSMKKGYNALTVTFDRQAGIGVYSLAKEIDFVVIERAAVAYAK